jgi:hypothetical protein
MNSEFRSSTAGWKLLTAGADPRVPDVALTNTSDAFVSFSVFGTGGGGVCSGVSEGN